MSKRIRRQKRGEEGGRGEQEYNEKEIIVLEGGLNNGYWVFEL